MTDDLRHTPRLGDGDRTRRCNRWLADGRCQEPPAVHILWMPAERGKGPEHSMACATHAAEVVERWLPWQVHPLLDACARPGSAWVENLRVCLTPDEADAIFTTRPRPVHEVDTGGLT